MDVAKDYFEDFDPGLVSVVIPAFNAAATIAETIESCLAQDYPKIEIVVVNDGSTDATGEVLSRFGSKIRVLSQPKRGLAAARNAGMRHAKGEYIAWLDADDIAFKERLSVQVQVLRQFEDVALVSSDFCSFVHNGPDLDRSHRRSHIRAYYSSAAGDRLREIYPLARTLRSDDGRSLNLLLGNVYGKIVLGSFVHPPTVMLRRQSLQKSGWCDEDLRFPDFDFFIASARHGDFAYIDAPLLRYRHSDNQDSQEKNVAAINLETVRITEKLLRTDPVYYRNNRAQLETASAKAILDAARQLAFTDRSRAIRLIARSVKYKILLRDIIVALAAVLTPAFIRPMTKTFAISLGLIPASARWPANSRASLKQVMRPAAWSALGASIALAGALIAFGEG